LCISIIICHHYELNQIYEKSIELFDRKLQSMLRKEGDVKLKKIYILSNQAKGTINTQKTRL